MVLADPGVWHRLQDVRANTEDGEDTQVIRHDRLLITRPTSSHPGVRGSPGRGSCRARPPGHRPD
ncbi:hypothetical protein SGPA1_40715 [Streptomyces misionensis JCM 4497]